MTRPIGKLTHINSKMENQGQGSAHTPLSHEDVFVFVLHCKESKVQKSIKNVPKGQLETLN